MATHRYQSIGVVMAAATTLLVGGSVPAQATPSPALSASAAVSIASSGSSPAVATSTPFTDRVVLAAHRRAAARRLATSRAAARQRVIARAAALRSARAHAIARQALGTATNPATATPPATAPAAVTAAVTASSSVSSSVSNSTTRAATPSPVAFPSDSPSGQPAPRGDLPGWHQKYVEDFSTDVATGSFPGAYASHWYAYADGVRDTSRNGTYMPSKVLSVHDGVLDYAIHSEGAQHLVSAPVMKDTYGQVYGRYSVRFRSDQLAGYKNAWLLWPDSGRWPDDGEIDGPEGDLDGTINTFAHFARPGGGQDAFASNASFSSWHTVTIEWVPGKVTFYLDGAVLGTSTQNVPTTAMHWVLQTETSLGGAAPAGNVAGHVLIDWVALYTRA